MTLMLETPCSYVLNCCGGWISFFWERKLQLHSIVTRVRPKGIASPVLEISSDPPFILYFILLKPYIMKHTIGIFLHEDRGFTLSLEESLAALALKIHDIKVTLMRNCCLNFDCFLFQITSNKSIHLLCLSKNYQWSAKVFTKSSSVDISKNKKDNKKEWICRTVGPSLGICLELLAHCQNAASLSLCYRYYFGRCSCELA